MSEKLFDVALVNYVFVENVQSDKEVINFLAKSKSQKEALKIQSDYNTDPKLKGHAELYATGILENPVEVSNV